MLREIVEPLDRTAGFFPPADIHKIKAVERSFKLKLPDELGRALQESNGLTADHSAWLVWPIERILKDNRLFRSKPEFRELYMPFNHLLFVGDSGNGDQFAYPILGGVIRSTDIYLWDHESDNRIWYAGSLEDYLKRKLSKKSTG